MKKYNEEWLATLTQTPSNEHYTYVAIGAGQTLAMLRSARSLINNRLCRTAQHGKGAWDGPSLRVVIGNCALLNDQRHGMEISKITSDVLGFGRKAGIEIDLADPAGLHDHALRRQFHAMRWGPEGRNE